MKSGVPILAFIPARGGSKRLPGKNIRPFNGRPLIYYSIVLARSTPEIDRVVVSTDDDEIAACALSFGAEVIERPAELASDTASTATAIKHALLELDKGAYRPEAVVTLQPTNPLRPLSLIQLGIERFFTLRHRVDSVITVSANHHKYGVIEEERYLPVNYQPGSRSQDLKPLYYENGLLYVCSPQLVIEHETPFGERIYPLIVDEIFSRGDIDTELDFQYCEFLYRAHQDQLEAGLIK